MPTGTITQTISVGGVEFSGAISKTATGQVSHVVALAAGVAGLRSTGGVDNLATGHGLTAAQIINVHWTDPTDSSHKVRRQLTIDTATANAITFDETPAGEGDTLPATSTAVVVSVEVVVDTDFDGDLMEMIAMKCDQRAMADFESVTPATLLAQKLAATQPFTWTNGQGVANPLTGLPVDRIKITNGSVVAATYYLGVLYRSS